VDKETRNISVKKAMKYLLIVGRLKLPIPSLQRKFIFLWRLEMQRGTSLRHRKRQFAMMVTRVGGQTLQPARPGANKMKGNQK
jgi:hypothetical protein